MWTSDRMLIGRKPAVWAAAGATAVVMAAAVYGVSTATELKFITGAVLRQDPDLGRQLPVANAEISLGDELSNGVARTDSSCLFHLRLRSGLHIGRMVTLSL